MRSGRVSAHPEQCVGSVLKQVLGALRSHGQAQFLDSKFTRDCQVKSIAESIAGNCCEFRYRNTWEPAVKYFRRI